MLDDDGYSLLTKIGVVGPTEKIKELAAQSWQQSPPSANRGQLPRAGSRGRCAKGAAVAGQGNPLEDLGQIVAEVTQLDQASQDFMQVLSVFRKPVHVLALASVFHSATKELAHLTVESLKDLLGKLKSRMFVDADEQAGMFWPNHGLVQQVFRMKVADTWPPDQVQGLHATIMRHYLEQRARMLPEHPSLQDLTPYLEAAFHGLQAGRYDEVWSFGTANIIQEEKFTLVAELQAFQTMLDILDGIPSRQKRATRRRRGTAGLRLRSACPDLARGIALCQRNLGRIKASLKASRQAIEAAKKAKDWSIVSFACQNLATAHMYRKRTR